MAKYRFEQIAINCKEKKKPTEEDRFTYIGLEHLDTGSLNVTRFGSDVAPIGEKLIMRKGDVLFGKRRAYQKKVAVAPFDGIFSAHGMVLRPKEDVVDKNFFPLFISSDYFLDAAIKISVGSLSPTINWRDLKDLEFEMPDLHTQKKLAEVLWAINNAIESYKKLISATDELVKSQFLGECQSIPEDAYRTLDEVCTLITDGTHQPPKFVDRGIPFLLVSNITGNEVTYDTPKFITEETYFELSKRTPIEIGDLLLSTVGSYGHPAIVKENRKFSFQRHIAFLKPDYSQINSVFLHTAILSPNVQEQIESLVLGVAQKTLNLSAIKKIRIPLPPLALQEQFAAFVRQSDKSKFAVLSCLKHRLPLRFQDLETIRYLIDPSGRREFSQQLSQENYNG